MKCWEALSETLVSLRLRITLWVLSVLGATPAQLRRARDGWRLAKSPTLTKYQRLIAVVTNVMLLSAVILDLNLEKPHRVRIGQTTLSAAVYITETCLILLVYSLGVLTAPRQLERTISVLQRIHKMKSSLEKRKRLVHNGKAKHVQLILYLSWQFMTYSLMLFLTFYQRMYKNFLVATLYIIYGYLALVLALTQLHWSMILLEICSALTFINDELDIMLNHAATAQHGRFDDDYIYHLNLSYGAICDMLVQVDQNNGLFLLCSFLLLFMHLLITPYNLIAVILCTNCKENLDRYMSIGIQINWCLLHLSRLISLVEPCHRLQEQRERTGLLLNKLVGVANRRRLDHSHLDLFLLQAQVHECTLAPCGMFTITRPLLASIVGGVATYLIIMVQFQAMTEEI